MLLRSSVDGAAAQTTPTKTKDAASPSRTTLDNTLTKAEQKVETWLNKEETVLDSIEGLMGDKLEEEGQDETTPKKAPSPKLDPVTPPPAFVRQNSECRDFLIPHQPDAEERRAYYANRAVSAGQQDSTAPSRTAMGSNRDLRNMGLQFEPDGRGNAQETATQNGNDFDEPLRDMPSPAISHDSEEQEHELLISELGTKFILNLSMHFRIRSSKEKFFLTYARRNNEWHRLTITIDYRQCEPGSLEADLKDMKYQKDKCFRIYQVIRKTLLDINFEPTVTNLKLKTEGGQLHIAVTEDLVEVIHYPRVSVLQHIDLHLVPRVKESDIVFESHLSGYVYKVRVHGRTSVKKEIPSPGAVQEFLYEATALAALSDSKNVVQVESIVVDDKGERIKGLLVKNAGKGALADLLEYKDQRSPLTWNRKQRWARDIIRGLSEIHEAGFVQGDFTLTNIVVDGEDNVRIIDINHRGCPVGWEPPELLAYVHSGMRTSSFINTKTDLFQLGMVLWALANESIDPEREERPFFPLSDNIPDWYRQIVDTCLSDDPRNRQAAKELLRLVPVELPQDEIIPGHGPIVRITGSPPRPDTEYIDPTEAVGLEDIPATTRSIMNRTRSQVSDISSGRTFTDARTSSEFIFGSQGSRGVLPKSERDVSPATQPDDLASRTRRTSDASIDLESSFHDAKQHLDSSDLDFPELVPLPVSPALSEPKDVANADDPFGPAPVPHSPFLMTGPGVQSTLPLRPINPPVAEQSRGLEFGESFHHQDSGFEEPSQLSSASKTSPVRELPIVKDDAVPEH